MARQLDGGYTNFRHGNALMPGVGMTERSSSRASIVAFIAILAVSAGTMLWLFWRFPVTTAIVTLVVLGFLAVLGWLARSTDTDSGEMDHGKQRI